MREPWPWHLGRRTHSAAWFQRHWHIDAPTPTDARLLNGAIDDSGRTGLMLALLHGRGGVAQALVEPSALPQWHRPDDAGNTAAHYLFARTASSSLLYPGLPYANLVEALTQAGAPLLARNADGRNAVEQWRFDTQHLHDYVDPHGDPQAWPAHWYISDWARMWEARALRQSVDAVAPECISRGRTRL